MAVVDDFESDDDDPASAAFLRDGYAIVGNELAMQRGIGLSVQLLDNDSSLLPIHADVWDRNSPFVLRK